MDTSKCFKAVKGDSLGGHQKEENAESSGYLITSEQNRKTSSWSPEIHRESAVEKVIFSKLAVLLNLSLARVCRSLI